MILGPFRQFSETLTLFLAASIHFIRFPSTHVS